MLIQKWTCRGEQGRAGPGHKRRVKEKGQEDAGEGQIVIPLKLFSFFLKK